MQAFRSTLGVSARRAVVQSNQRTAAFSVSSRYSKDAADSVKETLDSANKTAGQAILKGVIEPAETASNAIKSAVGAGTREAGKLADDAKASASNVNADAKANAHSAAREAQAQTQTGSVTGDLKSKANELAEDVKGAATNASYTAEQAKAEAGKKMNNAATEAKKAAQ